MRRNCHGRRFGSPGILTAAVLLLAGSSIGAEVLTDTEDLMFRRDETTQAGRVVDLDEQYLSVEVRLGEGDVTGTVAVPRADVSRVEFYVPPEEEQLLAAPDPRRLQELEELWAERQKFLRLPNSNAARIATVLGEVLLQKEDPESAERALQLFTLVEEADWNPSRRGRAQQGRLRAMIALGDAEAAVGEALLVAEEAEAPEVLLEAKLVLAEAAFQELLELIEENPRWEEDIRVRPERNRLYNQALDLFLYPYLFFGSDDDAAPRGLWGAIRVYRSAGDKEEAAACAEDLALLYPQNPLAAQAREWLESIESTSDTTESL